jgi:hypothetical protein
MCPPGFVGKRCEINLKRFQVLDDYENRVRNTNRLRIFASASPLKCSNDLCFNRGNCLVDKSNNLGYKCNCLPYFTGPTCMINFNPCEENTCGNKSQLCITNGHSFTCIDSPRYQTLSDQMILFSTTKHDTTAITTTTTNPSNSFFDTEKIEAKINRLNHDSDPNQFNMPEYCKDTIQETDSSKNDDASCVKLRIAKTPYANDSYYIIENNSIWYIKNGQFKNGDKWPKKIEQIFPDTNLDDDEESIDAALYDDFHGHFLIFKVI